MQLIILRKFNTNQISIKYSDIILILIKIREVVKLKMDIKILATTSFAILAVAVVLAVIGYITLGSGILVNLAFKIAILIIFGGIIIGISKSVMKSEHKFYLIIIFLVIMLILIIFVNF